MVENQQAPFLRIWAGFVFLYILSVSFLTLFHFPVVGLKVQLPEFVFLGMCGFLLFHFKKINWSNFRFNRLDFCLLSYPIVLFITSFFAENFAPFLETLGISYLFINYLIIKVFLIEYKMKSKPFFFTAILCMGSIAAIFALLGMLLYLLKIPNSLIWIYENFPYFGDSIRLQGFALRPTMLANILSISTLFLFSKMWIQADRKLFHWLLLVLMMLACILTLSKGILLLTGGILFICSQRPKLSNFLKRLLQTGMFVFLAVYLFGTHFLIVDKNHPQLTAIQIAPFNTGEPIASTKAKLLLPTAYTALKQASFTMGNQHILTGVGAGNHNFYIDQLKKEGRFPKQIPNLDPHSTYFGGFAELGALGLLSIFLMIFIIGKISSKLLRRYPYDYFTVALVSCLLVMSLEAIARIF